MATLAGQFIISASSQKEFDKIVKDLKKQHDNGILDVTYTYEPKDAGTSITWVPFVQPADENEEVKLVSWDVELKVLVRNEKGDYFTLKLSKEQVNKLKKQLEVQ